MLNVFLYLIFMKFLQGRFYYLSVMVEKTRRRKVKGAVSKSHCRWCSGDLKLRLSALKVHAFNFLTISIYIFIVQNCFLLSFLSQKKMLLHLKENMACCFKSIFFKKLGMTSLLCVDFKEIVNSNVWVSRISIYF